MTGGSLRRVSNVAWDPGTTTWNTPPRLDGPLIETAGPAALGAIVEFRLDGVVTGDGLYSFAIDTTAADSVSYVSSAAPSGQKPTLVLTVGASAAPAVTVLQPARGATFFTGDRIAFQGQAVDAADGIQCCAVVVVQRAGPPRHGRRADDIPRRRQPRDHGRGHRRRRPHRLGAGGRHRAPAARSEHAAAGRDHGAAATGRRSPPPTRSPSPPPPATWRMELLTVRLAWTSDRDGALGTGGAFARPLSAGTHRITASVTDAGGLAGAAAVTVIVRVPMKIEFPAIADAFVDAGLPTFALGRDPLVRVDANTLRIAYLRFQVTGTGNAVAGQSSGSRPTPPAAPRRIRRAGLRHVRHQLGRGAGHLQYPACDQRRAARDLGRRQVKPGDGLRRQRGGGRRRYLRLRHDEPVERRRGLSLARGRAGPQADPHAARHGARGRGDRAARRHHHRARRCTDLRGQRDRRRGRRPRDAIAWTSSLDGALGTGRSITISALRAGTHVVTAAVTDPRGSTGQARIAVVVRAPNHAPAVPSPRRRAPRSGRR